MNLEEFLEMASSTRLSERQAEALYRRAEGQSRSEAANAMDISPSNLDNAERSARGNIQKASNLLALAESIGAANPRTVGACAICDISTDTLHPDPRDDSDLENRRMICPDCFEQLDV